jgi:hypothetical protein
VPRAWRSRLWRLSLHVEGMREEGGDGRGDKGGMHEGLQGTRPFGVDGLQAVDRRAQLCPELSGKGLARIRSDLASLLPPLSSGGASRAKPWNVSSPSPLALLVRFSLQQLAPWASPEGRLFRSWWKTLSSVRRGVLQGLSWPLPIPP